MEKIDYIFCISPGRSGSDYLCQIFDAAKDCVSVHEPVPLCNGRAMQAYLHGRTAPLDRLMPEKVASIAALKGDRGVYTETSNCFIKGFGWQLPAMLGESRMGVVILNRDPEAVVRSYQRIGVSGLSNTGRKWHILPTRPDPLVQPPSCLVGPALTYRIMRLLAGPFRNSKLRRLLGLQSMSYVPRWITDYEIAITRWYVAETRALAEAFQSRFPGVRYYETDVTALNDLDNVEQMFRFFGLEPTARLAAVVGVATNLKRHHLTPSG